MNNAIHLKIRVGTNEPFVFDIPAGVTMAEIAIDASTAKVVSVYQNSGANLQIGNFSIPNNATCRMPSAAREQQ